MTETRTDVPDGDKDIEAAELALGVLDRTEAKQIRSQLKTDPDVARSAEKWIARFNQLLDEPDPVPVPSGAEERLMARFEREAASQRAGPATSAGVAPQQTSQAQTTLWNSLRFWRGLGLAATGVACFLAIMVFNPALIGLSTTPSNSVDDGVRLVATLNPEQSGSYLIRVASGGTLEGTTLANLGEDTRVPELWLVPDEGPTLSLGLLPRTGSTNLAIPPELVERVTDGALLAITLEPPGGAPGGNATGPIVATGTLSTLAE